MTLFSYLFLISCLLLMVNAEIFKIDQRKVRYIVNGFDVEPNKPPYMVSIKWQTQPLCGGAIYNEHYVITAAHCVNRIYQGDIRVVVTERGSTEPKSIHHCTKIILYEDFINHRKDDIALIKVDPPFQLNGAGSAVTLPSANLSIPDDTIVMLAGWGRLKNPETGNSKILQKVYMRVIPEEQCRKAHESRNIAIHPTQLCTQAINSSIMQGSCVGDSGGPVILGENLLVGIISFSVKNPCADLRFPDVHTRVSEYVDWIKDHV